MDRVLNVATTMIDVLIFLKGHTQRRDYLIWHFVLRLSRIWSKVLTLKCHWAQWAEYIWIFNSEYHTVEATLFNWRAVCKWAITAAARFSFPPLLSVLSLWIGCVIMEIASWSMTWVTHMFLTMLVKGNWRGGPAPLSLSSCVHAALFVHFQGGDLICICSLCGS